ncbi:MAG: YlmC/YmxH family sporulation protein [Bacillota bacterium]|nr:YlmC/YmxH family sporulation protein [Bacillota bacterium]
MLARISDLRLREVINVTDGRRLGYIDDLELDATTGQVTAIILPARARFFHLFPRNEEIVIPWKQIRRIGTDVILVEPAYLVDHTLPRPEK